MGHRGRRKENEGSGEKGVSSNQRIKEVFLEEEAPNLDFEEWVGSRHAEIDSQGREFHAEETI